MKGLFLLIAFCCISLVSIGQGWEKNVGIDSTYLKSAQIFATNDGGCLITAKTDEPDFLALIKLDSLGNEQWNKVISDLEYRIHSDCLNDTIIVSGVYHTDSSNVRVTYYDIEGNELYFLDFGQIPGNRFIKRSHVGGFYTYHDKPGTTTLDYYSKFSDSGELIDRVSFDQYHFTSTRQLGFNVETIDGSLFYSSINQYTGSISSRIRIFEFPGSVHGVGLFTYTTLGTETYPYNIAARGPGNFFFVQRFHSPNSPTVDTIGAFDHNGFIFRKEMTPLIDSNNLHLNYRIFGSIDTTFLAVSFLQTDSTSFSKHGIAFLDLNAEDGVQPYINDTSIILDHYILHNNNVYGNIRPDYSFNQDGYAYVAGKASEGEDSLLITKVGYFNDYLNTPIEDTLIIPIDSMQIDTIQVDTVNMSNTDSLVFESAVILYPNPSNGDFSIHLSEEHNQSSFELRIYNTEGKLLDRRAYADRFIQYQNAKLTSGMYFVQIFGDGKLISTKRLKISP